MQRRRFLRVAATGSALALAGCSEDAGDRGTDATSRRTPTDATARQPTDTPADASMTRRTRRGTPSSTPAATSDPSTTNSQADDSTDASEASTDDSTATDGETDRGTDDDTERADFLWAEQALWGDERSRENLFGYADRHDLAVVIAHAESNRADIGERLAEPLAAADERGVEAWVNTGVLSTLTPEAFVNDAKARRTYLDRLRRAARTYAEHVPGGRLIAWQEAPVGGEWVEGGAWNDQALANLREFGPRIFAAQKHAIAEAAPDLDVGIFVHFPYIVDSKKPEVFAGLMDDLRERDALPDFTFADFYRGWYEKDAGPETANRAVRSLITNAREHTGGEVLYMGGAHTINPQHTPSKQAIRLDLRASTGVNADGLGWYARTAYRTTQRGFDSFVPNRVAPERVPDTPRASTATFARDRYQYAYAALRECHPNHDPGDAFDLWLVGENFSFYEHRLSARTRDGTWELVGDFDGYVAGTRPTAERGADSRTDPPRVSIFRGLDRERFLSATGNLQIEIETDAKSTDARLHSVLVTPSGTGGYLTEPAAAAALEERGNIDAFALGRTSVESALNPGESIRVELPVAESADRPFRAFAHPAHATAIERLHTAEVRAAFDPGARFDLWIEGRGLDAIDRPEERLYVPGGSSGTDSRRYLTGASVTITTTANGAVAYGLDRDALLDRVSEYGVAIEDDARTPDSAATDRVAIDRTTSNRTTTGSGGASLRAAYAMAYFGSRNFVPAKRAVETITADRAEARTFSLKHAKIE